MISVEYANAYSEVLEILKYISKEDYEKIPNSKIELFETNHNEDYIFKYNPNKTLDEQNVSKLTKGMIAILLRDYLINETQKEKIIYNQKLYREKLEEEKRRKYSVDNIFDNPKSNLENQIKTETTLVNTKKEKWYEKIFFSIKNFFKK